MVADAEVGEVGGIFVVVEEQQRCGRTCPLALPHVGTQVCLAQRDAPATGARVLARSVGEPARVASALNAGLLLHLSVSPSN